MKKVIVLLLLVILTVQYIVILSACKNKNGNENGNSNNGGVIPPDDDENDGEDDEGDEDGGENTSMIIVPPYKDYNRGTVDFDKVLYNRPRIQNTDKSINTLTEKIEGGLISFEESLSAIESLENEYKNYQTMYNMTLIMTSSDSTNQYWIGEYEYLDSYYPTLSSCMERLYAACADSEYAQRYEEDHFGAGFIEKYADRMTYSDTVTEYMNQERALVDQFNSLNESTITIDYLLETDTAANFKNIYKNDKSALAMIQLLYRTEYEKLAIQKYVELLKIRRQIADEAGFDSYIDFAYSKNGYSYSKNDAILLMNDVNRYMVSTYIDLITSSNLPSSREWDHEAVINRLYSTCALMGDDFLDIYSYMLQHKLYNISPKEDNRYSGSFITYLYGNNSPYMHVTTGESVLDFANIAYGFGQFAEAFTSGTKSTNNVVNDLCANSFVLLMVDAIAENMNDDDYLVLEYRTFISMLQNIVVSSIYTAFEYSLYDLENDEITDESVKELIINANSELQESTEGYIGLSISSSMFTSMATSPLSLQEDVISAIPAFEIFFKEKDEDKSGLNALREILNRENKNQTITDCLDEIKMTSPFENGFISHISEEILHYTMGTRTPVRVVMVPLMSIK